MSETSVNASEFWDAAVESCMAEIEMMAIEQEQSNRRSPNHAADYDSWRDRVGFYRQAKDRIAKLKGQLVYHERA